MIPLITLPARILKLLEENISPAEVAAGVCLGMFMGFTPLNGPMLIILILFFLFVKLNRVSTILTLPIFKIFYVLGVSALADKVGGYLLIDAKFLTGLWRWLTNLPVVTYFDLNNTVVIGGLAISAALCAPVFMLAKKVTVAVREKYGKKINSMKFVKWVKRIPIVHKVSTIVARIRGRV